jgi:hypothetical protein
MTCKNYLFIASIVLMLLTSCTHYYYPAQMNNNIAYRPKPLSTDTAKTSNYVSGGFVTGFSSNAEFDSYTYGIIDLGRAHTLKWMNIYYGAYALTGSYYNAQLNDSDPNHFHSKDFSNLGGCFSVDFFTHSGHADIRFLGAEVTYSHEYGAYANFRKAVSNQPDYYVDTRTDLTTIALTSEVAWRGLRDPNIEYAIRGYVSLTPGHTVAGYFDNSYSQNNKRSNVSGGGAFYFQYHRLFAILENGDMFHTSFKVGYRF